MHKRLPHITELNNALIKEIVAGIENDLSRDILDYYRMQRLEYSYIFTARGLLEHPGKLETVANEVKILLRKSGYSFTLTINNDHMFTLKVQIPERYTN